MKQIYINNNETPTLSGSGILKYQLWVNDGGSFYVKITENSNEGRFSPLLFSVSEYAPERHKSIDNPCGLNLTHGGKRESANNNDGAFLKAVLQHLLDGKAPA